MSAGQGEQLLPCPNPWCGSTEIIRISALSEDGKVDGEVRQCLHCGLTGPRGNDEADGLRQWNTRHRTTDSEMVEAWPLGTRVTKTKGSWWTGKVVGYYSTSLTPHGVCIENEREWGSVQIYPVSAIRIVSEQAPVRAGETK